MVHMGQIQQFGVSLQLGGFSWLGVLGLAQYYILPFSITYCISLPLQPTIPIPFPLYLYYLMCRVAYADCSNHRKININMKFSYCFYVTKDTK